MKKPTKKGQIVQFLSPLPDEDPNQKYVIVDIHFDLESPRADIKAINKKLSLPPINTVLVEELRVVES